MHGAYCTNIRHHHRGGMLNKTPPPTELQIPATVTTLVDSGSMVDIQCATAEIRRGKKEEEETTG